MSFPVDEIVGGLRPAWFRNCSIDKYLDLLLVLELEGLDSADAPESLALALRALELEDDLLVDLCLSFLDWLLLTAESLLLHVVSSLSLGSGGFLTLLVLSDLHEGVLLELRAVGSSGLWISDHDN